MQTGNEADQGQNFRTRRRGSLGHPTEVDVNINTVARKRHLCWGMSSPLLRPPTHRLSAVATWTAAIAVLTPLILLAGLIAVIAVPGVTLSRNIGLGILARRRPALAPVVHLDAPSRAVVR
jgi:hypothetical protein